MFTLEMTNIGMARMFALVNSLDDQHRLFALTGYYRVITGYHRVITGYYRVNNGYCRVNNGY
jgi:hypothetical protein